MRMGFVTPTLYSGERPGYISRYSENIQRCVCVCVALFNYTDIGESLRSRCHSSSGDLGLPDTHPPP